MRAELFEFQWDVYNDGYRWIDTITANDEKQKGPFLTDGQRLGARGFAILRYNPLALFSGLFRVFAETEPTADGIKAFADKYGPLGGDAEKIITLHESHAKKGHYVGVGEDKHAWRNSILAMRRAVDLWDKARLGDVEYLSQVIRWDDEGVHYISESKPLRAEHPDHPRIEAFSLIATEKYKPAVLERFRRDDVIEPALYYIQRTVNENLKGQASPRLLWNRDHRQLGLRIVPGSLAGALWLQFAHAIERDSDFRRCSECGIWFELSVHSGRSDKVYCSNACRSRAYRKRQATAVSLHAEGHSESEIAERLNSDIDAVKGWIAKSQVPRRSRGRT